MDKVGTNGTLRQIEKSTFAHLYLENVFNVCDCLDVLMYVYMVLSQGALWKSYVIRSEGLIFVNVLCHRIGHVTLIYTKVHVYDSSMNQKYLRSQKILTSVFSSCFVTAW